MWDIWAWLVHPPLPTAGPRNFTSTLLTTHHSMDKYTVFGKVISGMNVALTIGNLASKLKQSARYTQPSYGSEYYDKEYSLDSYSPEIQSTSKTEP